MSIVLYSGVVLRLALRHRGISLCGTDNEQRCIISVIYSIVLGIVQSFSSVSNVIYCHTVVTFVSIKGLRVILFVFSLERSKRVYVFVCVVKNSTQGENHGKP